MFKGKDASNEVPKNSVAIFRGTGLGVFGLLNVPKKSENRIFLSQVERKLFIFVPDA
jgi:hypothetical protein